MVSHAAAIDASMAFDPNLPAELHRAVPREIADTMSPFARGAGFGFGEDVQVGRAILAGRQAPDDCALKLEGRDCVTYGAIEAAFQEAVERTALDLPRGEWLPPNVGTVGSAILRASMSIARRYEMTQYEIEYVLPRADTLSTSIANVCPDFVTPIQCHPKRYRRIDGLCNNVRFPNWGATRRVFQRLLEPNYIDGMGLPAMNHLPSPRLVSVGVHQDRELFDHASTLMLIAWGQFLDHDMTLTFTRPDERTLNEPEDCCRGSGPEDCLPIGVQRNDPFYSRHGVDCMDFVRSQPGVRQFCRLGSRIGFNVLTSVIDGNTVYGQTHESSSVLRMFEGGKLKSYLPEHFKQHNMLPLLPLRFEHQDEGCIRDHPGQRCFLAGEIRVNEQLVLSTMHLSWFREHNRICDILRDLNPHWDDEKLYQEARRIVVACIQHITYDEFLPMLLGKTVMKEHDLILTDHGYWDGYNEYEDPSITLAFMTSAYRFGHSLLPSTVERWSPNHKYIDERDLSDLIRKPFDLYKPGAVDEYILGQLNQPAMAMDFAVTEEVTTMLFRQPNVGHGIDLVSLNLQRAREMGVPGYMHYRKWCGLPTADSFLELTNFVSNHTAAAYAQLYKSPWDIDLFSGGISERPLPHSMVGPTFACIIGAQLHKLRHGDRFWYELGNQPSSFTPEQLEQIRRVQLSRVLCDNTDLIKTIQVYPLVLPDYEVNPRVPCDSGVIPRLDFSYWKEILP
ncbi:chorion peroxidase-like [Pollicipes pollicipes]|uniref:chorion peroxidase-like n=1 Tax=Pollicipes pollicipes TaxID=41117 RepID=UPI001884AA15|nr:chorion peroxidase-like [Pollicipes pollicipes]